MSDIEFDTWEPGEIKRPETPEPEPIYILDEITIADFLVGDGEAVAARVRSKVLVNHVKVYPFEYQMFNDGRPKDSDIVVKSDKFYDTEYLFTSRAVSVAIVSENLGFILAMTVLPTLTLKYAVNYYKDRTTRKRGFYLTEPERLDYIDEEDFCLGYLNFYSSEINLYETSELKKKVYGKENFCATAPALFLRMETWNPRGPRSEVPRVSTVNRISKLKYLKMEAERYPLKLDVEYFHGPRLYEADNEDVLPRSMFVDAYDAQLPRIMR